MTMTTEAASEQRWTAATGTDRLRCPESACCTRTYRTWSPSRLSTRDLTSGSVTVHKRRSGYRSDVESQKSGSRKLCLWTTTGLPRKCHRAVGSV